MKKQVTLASGAQSDFYVDCRKVTLDPEGGSLVGIVMAALIAQVAKDAHAVGGMTMGADPIVTATAIRSFANGTPLHSFYVRKEPKGHGTGKQIESSFGLQKAANVVLVEDVVTTGGSTKRAFDAVTQAGHTVAAIVTIVDRQEGGATLVASLAPYYALYVKEDLVS